MFGCAHVLEDEIYFHNWKSNLITFCRSSVKKHMGKVPLENDNRHIERVLMDHKNRNEKETNINKANMLREKAKYIYWKDVYSTFTVM